MAGALVLWAMVGAAAAADQPAAGQGVVAGAPASPAAYDFMTDPLTGVAIYGYDPVSYFAAGDALPGKPDFELDWAGVSWYFATAANRDVFLRAPEVYAPQAGGHCVMSLARGYLSDGKPRLYAIYGGKLYFFYSTANRDAFLMGPEAAIKPAQANWATFTGSRATN